MNKEIEIPNDYEARIEGNKVILERKESEDERIRKNLIEWVREFKKLNPTNPDHNAECSEAIDWLEKQKDSDKARLAVELINKYIDEHTVNAHEMSDSSPDKKYYSGVDDTLSNIAGILIKAYSEEKQKEHFRDDTKMMQKPLSTEETELNSIAFLEQIGYTCIPSGKEQKPAEWHPEDEQNLNVCLSYIKDESLRSWLIDAIHVRYDKPAEWSEEDDMLMDELESYILYDKEFDDEQKSWRIKRLKSLRPQPQVDLDAIAKREYARGKQDGYWEGVKAERESCKTFHYESPNWPQKMPDLPTKTTTNEGVSSIQPH